MRKLNVINIMIIAMLLSCSPHRKFYPYRFVPTSLEKQPIKHVAVAPCNLIGEVPREIVGRENRLLHEIERYLHQHNKVVRGPKDLRSHWDRRRANSTGLFDAQTGSFKEKKANILLQKTIVEYCALKEVDAVVLPEVVPRKARLAGNYAYWDGVERRILIDSRYRRVDEFKYTGIIVGVSLKVLIFDKNGMCIFKSFGDIELATKLVYLDGIQQSASRDDHFDDAAMIQEAVKIAFHPFLKWDAFPKYAKFQELENKAQSGSGISVTPSKAKSVKEYEGE